tara:strand:- start:6547 stop:8667 length:2121 start_codon:yes stop_codon:yes gene_type:complete
MTILSSRKANVNANTGGGDKKQGLAPKATSYFRPSFNGSQYSTQTGSGKDRFKLVCMNQLGGIGKGKSQFASNADGAKCPVDNEKYDITYVLQDIKDINNYIQNHIKTLFGNSNSNSNSNIISLKQAKNFELCLVGSQETFLADIENANSQLWNTLSSGQDISGRIFTHLNEDDKYYIYLVTSDNNSSQAIPLNLLPIKDKIANVNKILTSSDYITNSIPPEMREGSTLGIHTLGLLNNNFKLLSSSTNTSKVDARTLLLQEGYGREATRWPPRDGGIYSYFRTASPLDSLTLDSLTLEIDLINPVIMEGSGLSENPSNVIIDLVDYFIKNKISDSSLFPKSPNDYIKVEKPNENDYTYTVKIILQRGITAVKLCQIFSPTTPRVNPDSGVDLRHGNMSIEFQNNTQEISGGVSINQAAITIEIETAVPFKNFNNNLISDIKDRVEVVLMDLPASVAVNILSLATPSWDDTFGSNIIIDIAINNMMPDISSDALIIPRLVTNLKSDLETTQGYYYEPLLSMLLPPEGCGYPPTNLKISSYSLHTSPQVIEFVPGTQLTIKFTVIWNNYSWSATEQRKFVKWLAYQFNNAFILSYASSICNKINSDSITIDSINVEENRITFIYIPIINLLEKITYIERFLLRIFNYVVNSSDSLFKWADIGVSLKLSNNVNGFLEYEVDTTGGWWGHEVDTTGGEWEHEVETTGNE